MVLFSQLNAEWTQIEVIDLVNDGTGLGFGIIGGKSTGVVIKSILPSGVADKVSEAYLVIFTRRARKYLPNGNIIDYLPECH